ncbi:hypothetical protein ACH79_16435 [Bradyrhizobium sp. CCBAU 051011]|uniref:hypothetical protein n=1 Tax=Bradyrhizobium sp. CCBAU 051011 TaxID=858422 RepID=UPI001373D71F|nr:hypothetical protein [Bradyrhizobium sp. CCBAU 051011]QHO73982.1 hypothetical protein ACH79_16435 [Bradyrhizobium sp. CCBAU 051011]
MHATIGESAFAHKPEAIALVAPYVDTIEVSSRRPFPAPLLRAIVKNSGSIIPNEVHDKNDPETVWFYLLAINQPSRRCIELLQWYSQYRRLSIYRLHLAIDVIDIAPDWARDEVIEVFRKLLHLRHRRGADDMHNEKGTIYSIGVAGRKSRPQKNTAFYIADHSKVTGECDAIHFEIRLERKRAVQAAEIDAPSDVMDIDPVAFVAKHLTAKDIGLMLEKIIQRSIKSHRPHSMIPIERRIRAHVRRYRLDHASGFAGAFKKQFERIAHWDCIDVEPVINWASADVACDQEVGELCSLLPPRPKPHKKRLIIRERL